MQEAVHAPLVTLQKLFAQTYKDEKLLTKAVASSQQTLMHA